MEKSLNLSYMKIKMYSADWCSDCRVAKGFLDEHNIKHEIVDVSKNQDAAEYVKSINGGKRVIPTFIIDGEIHTNPGIKELSRLIMQ